ncbi:hypothetical protein SDC9_201343 [bioreactor metagenome]|uniref:Uncharacterized protein n=1 Tax=bioreactor metagenome TaxID=1076179 RepID=A0A645ITF0_9ZZZZ
MPTRRPNAPACRGCFHVGRHGAGCVGVVSVCGNGIRRIFTGKIGDVADDGALRRTASRHGHINCDDAGFGRRVPPHPNQLAVTVRIVDIAHSIGRTLDVESYADGIIRIGLPAADLHRSYDVGVYAILVIKGIRHR